MQLLDMKDIKANELRGQIEVLSALLSNYDKDIRKFSSDKDSLNIMYDSRESELIKNNKDAIWKAYKSIIEDVRHAFYQMQSIPNIDSLEGFSEMSKMFSSRLSDCLYDECIPYAEKRSSMSSDWGIGYSDIENLPRQWILNMNFPGIVDLTELQADRDRQLRKIEDNITLAIEGRSRIKEEWYHLCRELEDLLPTVTIEPHADMYF